MKVVLTITLEETGQVAVTGPIDNTILCYGLLQIARDSVAAHHARAAQRLVQPAAALPPELAKSNGRG